MFLPSLAGVERTHAQAGSLSSDYLSNVARLQMEVSSEKKLHIIDLQSQIDTYLTCPM